MSREDWEEWRRERNKTLREPFGWLSLVSLDWLGEEPQELKTFPGTWTANDHTVTWNEQQFQISPGQSEYVEADGKQAEIASRFGRICVRVRDPQSPIRTGFQGTDAFDYDEEFVIRGQFKPYPQDRTLKVPSAYPGGTTTLYALGELTIPGEDPLVVTGSTESAEVIFRDPTTTLWRTAPVVDNQVDFNRAQFFPAHFTDFGTCPTPPSQNTLKRPIEAGEKQ